MNDDWMKTAKDRSQNLTGMLKRRGFYWPSFEIYGGARGFFDYGPLGSALKTNIEGLWRRYFVIGEGFAEISTPAITPEEVFIASGHLEKFSDVLTTCTKCGESFRADHLLEDAGVSNAEMLTMEEMQEKIREKSLKCPSCGGRLGDLEEFNLMFSTSVGAGTTRKAYMRPETAQAMFINFPTLYRYFREKLPFGVAQIGRGYRNEISPRQGLLRQREFNMAEIEVFINPKDNTHQGFDKVKDKVVHLLPRSGKEDSITLDKAHSNGIIENQWLAYYIGLTQEFLTECGLHPDKLRFRQHQDTEMAHYASDCWDAEALTSYGWIEIVGIADRTCFDLERHMSSSGVDMRASVELDEPITRKEKKVMANLKKLGPRFRKDAKVIYDHLAGGGPFEETDAGIKVQINGMEFELSRDEYTIEEKEVTTTKEKVIPHVIEPSFGIDRIIFSVLEQNYMEEEKDGEVFRKLSLPSAIAPITVGVFPLMTRDGLDTMALEIYHELKREGIKAYYDGSGSIGRRYARMDEVGTPYCITVDYDSLKDNSVTIRYRDTKEQKRIKIEDIHHYIQDML